MINLAKDVEHRTLSRLLEKIYRDSGYDFRQYKRGTVTRRLNRRLQATGTMYYDDYIRFLDSNPQEYENISQTLTTNVSSFFRSRPAFEQLNNLVFPTLFAQAASSRRLRFWSTACARGEEPYSIAMALTDYAGDELDGLDVKIHATDINRRILNQARAAVFSGKEIESVPEHKRRHLITCEGNYIIKDYIRALVSFDYCDLTTIAGMPFGEMDCIFCCNVLIYLHRQLQASLLAALCNNLVPGGYLVLGDVETPTENVRSQLKCLDTKAKIYQKKG